MEAEVESAAQAQAALARRFPTTDKPFRSVPWPQSTGFAKVVVQSDVSEVSDFGLSKVATSRCNNVTHSWVNLKKDNAFKNSFIFQTHLRGKLWFFHLQ